MDTGLTVHVGENLEVLTECFAALPVSPSDRILDPLWTVVPSAPVRQWLDWHLSRYVGVTAADRYDGVTANLAYLFPEEFVRRVEDTVLRDASRPRSAWEPVPLALRILRLPGPRRSFEGARRLAGEIDELVRWRPDVIRGREPAPAAAEEALRVYAQLQPALAAPLRQRDDVRAALRARRPEDLPPTLVLFGLPNVPGGAEFAGLVADLATHCAVHVLVPVPSVARARAIVNETAPDPSVLDGWFREADETVGLWRDAAGAVDAFTYLDSPARRGGVLDALRDTVRHGTTVVAPPDPSVRVVGAVGLARQVEVARDLVLEAVAEGVAPHDILVVTADPANVADAFERHWGHVDDGGAGTRPRVPFELTEVEATSARDRLHLSLALLDLVGNYVTRAQLAGLGTFPAFARALGDEGDRLWRLADEADVTFGVSPAQRRAFDVYDGDGDGSFRADAGTWQRLVDRVCATVYEVDTEAATLGVPDDLDALAGLHPLLRLLDESRDVRRHGTRDLSEWLDQLTTWLTQVAPDSGDDDSFERAVARARDWRQADDPPAALAPDELTFSDFTALWRDVVDTRTHQRIFGRGGVTVTRLTALGFAPYRMVVVVGLDEAALPAAELRSALLGPRRRGDPDARHALLGALLGATLSADERLVITWTARREDNGRRVDPPIVLEELLATLAHVTGAESRASQLTTSRHGFSVPRDQPGVVTTTYDPAYGAGPSTPPSAPDAAPPPASEDVAFATVRTFLSNPARSYLRRTLGAQLPPEGAPRVLVPPVTLDHRRRAALQRRFVEELADDYARLFAANAPPPYALAGETADERTVALHDAAAARRTALLRDERANANVPPRLWQHRMQFDQLTLAAYNLAVDRAEFEAVTPDAWPGLFEDVPLSDGTALTLPRDDDRDRVFAPQRSRADERVVAVVHFEAREGGFAKSAQVLRAVLDLLVLRAHVGEHDARVITYFLPAKADAYRVKRGLVLAGEFAHNPRATLRFTGDDADAAAALATIVAWYRRSRVAPVPLFRRTSVAAVVERTAGSPSASWDSDAFHVGEDRELAHELLFPYPYVELATLEPHESFPLASELRRALRHVAVSDLSQVDRAPGLALRAADPARWADATERFVPLLGEAAS